VLSLLAACATPGGLPALGALQTSAERLEAYESLRPIGNNVRVVPGDPEYEPARGEIVFVVLEDGRRIDDPAQLAAVVGADRETARAGRRVAELEQQSRLVRVAGVIVAIAGAGLWAYGEHEDDGVAELGGLAIVDVGLLTSLWLAPRYQRRANAARTRGFRAYERELRERLRLCLDGVRVVPCEVTP
jgi:hypothetical protein